MEEIDGEFLLVSAGLAGCQPSWADIVSGYGDDRYIRHAEASGSKATAVFLFVPPTKPDGAS